MWGSSHTLELWCALCCEGSCNLGRPCSLHVSCSLRVPFPAGSCSCSAFTLASALDALAAPLADVPYVGSGRTNITLTPSNATTTTSSPGNASNGTGTPVSSAAALHLPAPLTGVSNATGSAASTVAAGVVGVVASGAPMHPLSPTSQPQAATGRSWTRVAAAAMAVEDTGEVDTEEEGTWEGTRAAAMGVASGAEGVAEAVEGARGMGGTALATVPGTTAITIV